jgi:hypothetical protein
MPRLRSLLTTLALALVASCAAVREPSSSDVRYLTPMRSGQSAELELYVRPEGGDEAKHRLVVHGGEVLTVEVWRYLDRDGVLTGEETLLGAFPLTRELAMTLDYSLHRRRHPFPPVRFEGHVETVRIEWRVDGAVVQRELLGYDGGAGAFDEFGVDLFELIAFAEES